MQVQAGEDGSKGPRSPGAAQRSSWVMHSLTLDGRSSCEAGFTTRADTTEVKSKKRGLRGPPVQA